MRKLQSKQSGRNHKSHNILHYFGVVFFNLLKSLVGSIIWIIVGFAGYLIYQTKRTPFDLVIGLPLILIGGGMVIHGLWTLILTLFSPRYNREVCFLCKEEGFRNHKTVKKILQGKK